MERTGLPEVLRAVADPVEFRKQLKTHFLLQPIMFTDIFFVVDFMFLMTVVMHLCACL